MPTYMCIYIYIYVNKPIVNTFAYRVWAWAGLATLVGREVHLLRGRPALPQRWLRASCCVTGQAVGQGGSVPIPVSAKKNILSRAPVPGNPAAKIALHPRIWCSKSYPPKGLPLRRRPRRWNPSTAVLK